MVTSVLDVNELLRYVVEQGGSDLHLKVNSPPRVRIDGRLQQAPFDVLTSSDTERVAYAILPKDRADEFETTAEADFAHSVAGVGRFRVNVFRQRGSVGLVLRRGVPRPPSFGSLGPPPVGGGGGRGTPGPGVVPRPPRGGGRTPPPPNVRYTKQ